MITHFQVTYSWHPDLAFLCFSILDYRTHRHLFVLQNLHGGAFVIDVNATDDDIHSNGQVEYAIMHGSDNSFTINTTTGVITTTAMLDRETKNMYTVSHAGALGGLREKSTRNAYQIISKIGVDHRGVIGGQKFSSCTNCFLSPLWCMNFFLPCSNILSFCLRDFFPSHYLSIGRPQTILNKRKKKQQQITLAESCVILNDRNRYLL